MLKIIIALALSSLAFAQQQPSPAAQLKQEAESSPQSIEAQSNYIRYVAEEARRVPATQDAMFKSLRANYEAWARKIAGFRRVAVVSRGCVPDDER